MITEDYVSFETAKLLKEKGFNEFTYSYYSKDDEESEPELGMENLCSDNWNGTPDEVNDLWFSAPTLQMAMKWLREVHNIDIDIDAKVGILGRKVYLPTISTYRCREDSDRLMQKQFELSYKDDTAVVPALQYFNSYEEACEAAIKYCLKNLI